MTNHSDEPSMRPVRTEDGLVAVALDDMGPGDECTVDYREVMPLLRMDPPLNVGGVMRETPGSEGVVSDDSHTSLEMQLDDIAEGRYR